MEVILGNKIIFGFFGMDWKINWLELFLVNWNDKILFLKKLL